MLLSPPNRRLVGFLATLGLVFTLIPAPAMAQPSAPAAPAAARADQSPLLAAYQLLIR
jgi:peptidyl-dipeptidase Dcp